MTNEEARVMADDVAWLLELLERNRLCSWDDNACREHAAAIRQLLAENASLRGVLEQWKRWCELNRREGLILYKSTVKVLEGGGR